MGADLQYTLRLGAVADNEMSTQATVVVPQTGSNEDSPTDGLEFAVGVVVALTVCCIVIYIIAHAIDWALNQEEEK